MSYRTLDDIVSSSGLPALVEHEDGLRYQVLGIDPFRPNYYHCMRIDRTTNKPIPRQDAVSLWRFSAKFSLVPTGPKYISPDRQKEIRKEMKQKGNEGVGRQYQMPVKDKDKPKSEPEMGKVIPLRRK